MNRPIPLFMVFFAFCLAAPFTQAAFSDFTSHKNFTISAGTFSASVSDFPLLIEMYDTDLRDDTHATFTDIAFFDNTHTQLAHDTENFTRVYNATHAYLRTWARDDFTTAEKIIIMAYNNNTAISDQENKTGVWIADINARYAMSDGDNTSVVDDSTGTHIGEKENVAINEDPGQIGVGQNFTYTDGIAITSDFKMHETDNYTITAWIKTPADSGGQQYWADQWAGGQPGRTNVYVRSDNNHIQLAIDGGASITGNTTVGDDSWHHLALTRRGNTWQWYVDGSASGSSATSGQNPYQGVDIRIGSTAGSGFNGIIDELRSFSEAKSEAWIEADYSNQNNPSAFYTIGAESVPEGFTIVSPTNTTYTNATIDLQVTNSTAIDNWFYSLNGAANSSFTPNTTITGAEGSNYLIVYGNYTGTIYIEEEYFTLDTTAPTITIILPTTTEYLTSTLNLNATASETVGTWLYSVNGSANVSFTPNTTFASIAGNNLTLYVYANDTFGNMGSASVSYTVAIMEFNAWTDTDWVIEGGYYNFTYAVNHSSNVIPNATLTWNGTLHTYDGSYASGLITTFYKAIVIPNITNIQPSVNVTYPSYTWEVTSNFVGLNFTNSTNQSVYKIVLTECNGASTTLTLNFSLLDEADDSVVSGNIDSLFTTWFGGNSTYNRTHAFDTDSSTYQNICIYPAWVTYRTDADLTYDATGYRQRNYYLRNASISNSSSDTNLYLITNTTSDKVIIYTKNADDQAVSDVIVKILRFYPGTNTYTTVAIGNSDSEGKIITWLTLDTVTYKFILEQDTVVVNEYFPLVIADTELDPETLDLYIAETSPEYNDIMSGLVYSCTWNNATNVTRCTYTDTTGLAAQACLEVNEIQTLGLSQVCNTCDTSTAATLTCSLGTIEGDYQYVFSVNTGGGFYVIEQGYIYYPAANVYGTFGLLITILLIVICAGLTFYQPVASILLAVVALGVSAYMGFIEMSLGSFISLLIIVVILATVGRRGRA